MTKLSEQIETMRAEGKSYKQIQESLGCSKGTIAYYLGDGQKEKTRIRNRSRRAKVAILIQEYKQGSPCADCGENYPYWIMDFDHLDDKAFNISAFRTVTSDIDVVKREIEKCEVVCSNCHRDRTHNRLIKSGSDIMDISSYYQ